MNINKNRAFLAISLSIIAIAAGASSVTIPNEFVSGTAASATEVNANFNAMKTEIDDNDERIAQLEAQVADILAADSCTDGGSSLFGSCWYMADGGESCTAVCTAKGRFDDTATINVAGAPTIGDASNAAKCGVIVESLSNDLTTTTTYVINSGYSSVPGIGCLHDDQLSGGIGPGGYPIRPAIHVWQAATTFGASSQGHLRRICACQE